MAANSRATAMDVDTHVLREDQEKINKFAQQNARLDDISAEIKVKEKAVKELEDAEAEVLMMSEDRENIPYQMGDMFVHLSPEAVQQVISETKDSMQEQIEELIKRQEEIKKTMSQLRVELYNKFGDSINLEAD